MHHDEDEARRVLERVDQRLTVVLVELARHRRCNLAHIYADERERFRTAMLEVVRVTKTTAYGVARTKNETEPNAMDVAAIGKAMAAAAEVAGELIAEDIRRARQASMRPASRPSAAPRGTYRGEPLKPNEHKTDPYGHELQNLRDESRRRD